MMQQQYQQQLNDLVSAPELVSVLVYVEELAFFFALCF